MTPHKKKKKNSYTITSFIISLLKKCILFIYIFKSFLIEKGFVADFWAIF